MNPRPSYTWSVVCAWGLTIAVGAMTVSGVLAMFLRPGGGWETHLRTICVWAFAAVAGLALTNANNAAAAAMHAASRSPMNRKVFWPACVCALGFCFASVIGVHLGWEVMTHDEMRHMKMPEPGAVLAAGAFLAFGKVAMNWIVEGRRMMDKADADAAEASENARLDAIRQADIAARQTQNITPFKTRVQRAVVGGVTAFFGASAEVPDAPAKAPQEQTDAPRQTHRDAPADALTQASETHQAARQVVRQAQKKGASARASDAPDYEARCTRARQMLAASDAPSNRRIATLTRISPSTVDRLAREMVPLREPRTEAA